MPDVVAEEIYHAHALILARSGTPGDAALSAAEATEVVQAKAASLRDPAHRTSFLERVRLSREIVAASPAT